MGRPRQLSIDQSPVDFTPSKGGKAGFELLSALHGGIIPEKLDSNVGEAETFAIQNYPRKLMKELERDGIKPLSDDEREEKQFTQRELEGVLYELDKMRRSGRSQNQNSF